jgi:hypothetical protein
VADAHGRPQRRRRQVARWPSIAAAGAIASPVLAWLDEAPRQSPDTLQASHLFDQDELAALAALEAENVDLQQQKAGFFGPRIGTIIVIVLLLVLIL